MDQIEFMNGEFQFSTDDRSIDLNAQPKIYHKQVVDQQQIPEELSDSDISDEVQPYLEKEIQFEHLQNPINPLFREGPEVSCLDNQSQLLIEENPEIQEVYPQKNTQFNYKIYDEENPQPQPIISNENQQKQKKTQRNDTKNVGKGFMKAFAHFILKKDQTIYQLLKKHIPLESDIQSYKQFLDVNIRKPAAISRKDIKLFLNSEQHFCKQTRILGNYFLRKGFIKHIYNSKMQKRHIHLRYLPRWREIFANPTSFESIKN